MIKTIWMRLFKTRKFVRYIGNTKGWCYPPTGTIGWVVKGDSAATQVQWPKGTVEYDIPLWVANEDLEDVK